MKIDRCTCGHHAADHGPMAYPTHPEAPIWPTPHSMCGQCACRAFCRGPENPPAADHEPDHLAALERLAYRFQGIDLQYRRDADWPKPWRAVNHTSKALRAEFRQTGYGDTPGQAIVELIALIGAVKP